MGVAEENEAPDAGGAADDQAHSQHHPVRHPPAEPAHKEEAQDDLHPTQAVHQAVAQLPEAEVALRQRSHHGLRRTDNTEAEITVGNQSSYINQVNSTGVKPKAGGPNPAH